MPMRLHQGFLMPESPLADFEIDLIRKRIESLKRSIAGRGWLERFVRWVTDADDWERTQLAILEGSIEPIFTRRKA